MPQRGIERRKAAAFIGSLIFLIAHGAGAQESSEEHFRSVLVDYFKPLRFVPVLVNVGYGIGDVIDIDGISVLYRGKTCFPRLKLHEEYPQALPDLIEVKDIGMSFGLRLRRLFDSSTDVELNRAIHIRFDDTGVVAVTVAELRKSYDRAACPVIAPLLSGKPEQSSPGEHPYFIVGAVMYGRHEAMLRSAGNASAEASAHKVSAVVDDANLKVSAQAGSVISLSSRVRVPIALRPITIPGLVKPGDFKIRGGGKGKGEPNPGDLWQ